MSTLTSRYRRVTALSFRFPDDAADTVRVSVQVALRQVTEPNRVSLIVQQSGLTKVSAVLEGRMVSPLVAPEGLQAGMVALHEHAGVTGVLRVEPYEDALPDRLRRRFGQKVLFTWRTDEVP